MKTLRRIMGYPLSLAYVAVVVHSRGGFRKVLDVTKCATFVTAVAFLFVYVASWLGAVPH
jgi:hypothetical protein